MSEAKEEWNVELRQHTEDGSDYTEEDYEFDSEAEAMKFANANVGDVHDVRHYPIEGDSYSIW